MKNHLLNIGILAVLIFIGSPGCKPSPSPLILTEQSHAELTPYADTRIDTLNHIIELISQGGSSGIIFRNYTLFTPTVILISENFLHLCKQ